MNKNPKPNQPKKTSWKISGGLQDVHFHRENNISNIKLIRWNLFHFPKRFQDFQYLVFLEFSCVLDLFLSGCDFSGVELAMSIYLNKWSFCFPVRFLYLKAICPLTYFELSYFSTTLSLICVSSFLKNYLLFLVEISFFRVFLQLCSPAGYF